MNKGWLDGGKEKQRSKGLRVEKDLLKGIKE